MIWGHMNLENQNFTSSKKLKDKMANIYDAIIKQQSKYTILQNTSIIIW